MSAMPRPLPVTVRILRAPDDPPEPRGTWRHRLPAVLQGEGRKAPRPAPPPRPTPEPFATVALRLGIRATDLHKALLRTGPEVLADSALVARIEGADVAEIARLIDEGRAILDRGDELVPLPGRRRPDPVDRTAPVRFPDDVRLLWNGGRR